MALTIHIPSFTDRHQHYHTCPICKKSLYETNLVCHRQTDHPFPCMNHLSYYRDQLGMIDTLVDVYLNGQELQRFGQEWPDPQPDTQIFLGLETGPEIRLTPLTVSEKAAFAQAYDSPLIPLEQSDL